MRNLEKIGAKVFSPRDNCAFRLMLHVPRKKEMRGSIA